MGTASLSLKLWRNYRLKKESETWCSEKMTQLYALLGRCFNASAAGAGGGGGVQVAGAAGTRGRNLSSVDARDDGH